MSEGNSWFWTPTGKPLWIQCWKLVCVKGFLSMSEIFLWFWAPIGNLLQIDYWIWIVCLDFLLQILKPISCNLIGFLKVILLQKKFLKMPISHFPHKTLLLTNFYVVSKFAEHLQHFNDIGRLLKQIWLIRIFLTWLFNHEKSLI